jgi:hypothetical protein
MMPSWFGVIWKIMKTMLIPSFRKKVKMIFGRKLGKYLQSCYQQYLPDDMTSGEANTEEMVQDFLTHRMYLDDQMQSFAPGVVFDGTTCMNSISISGSSWNDSSGSLNYFSFSINDSLDCTALPSSFLRQYRTTTMLATTLP